MKNNHPICPMCMSTEVKDLETIEISELDKIYHREVGFSVAPMFGEHQTIDYCRCGGCDLRYFFPIISGTEEFYENLQKFDWYYFDDKPEFDFASSYIAKDAAVLEIGAGKGAFAKKISSGKYVGLEFSQQAILAAQKNGVELIARSIEDYSKQNKALYDVVCNFQVLEHVSNVDSFVKSSLDCLKPEGLMIISVPAADSFSRYVRNFCMDMPPHHLTRWSDQALSNVAKRYGLELVTIHHEGLQKVHRVLYANTIFSNALCGLIGKPYRAIDTSILSRIISKISTQLGKLYCKGLVDDDLLPRGLSVVAVYRKVNNG